MCSPSDANVCSTPNSAIEGETTPLLGEAEAIKLHCFYGKCSDSLEQSSTIVETKWEYQRRWLSMLICCVGSFTNVLQCSLYWVSLWPYLSQIDPSTPTSFFGLIYCGYSLGALIAAPLLGYWSTRSRSYRWPIITGLSINIAGNLIMAFLEAFPANSRRYVMLAARFVAGIGSGNDAVGLAFITETSTLKERSRIMSFQCASCSVAVFCGPALAAALSPVGYPAFVWGVLHLNMYTLEAFISAFISLICILLYLIPFKENHTGLMDQNIAKNTSENSNPNQGSGTDKLAVVGCVLIRFTCMFCVVYDETISSPLTMAMFSWTRSQAVLYNGIIVTTAGVVDFLGNIFVGVVFLKYVKERISILIGLLSFALFYLVSFSWPGLPLNHPGQNGNSSNGSLNVQNTAVLLSFANNTGKLTWKPEEQYTACHYSWCPLMPKIYVFQFVIAYFFLTIAMTFGYSANNSLFSKLLGEGNQGTWQGLIAAAGSLGMIISPALVSPVFAYFGPRVAWEIALTLLAAVIIYVGIIWNRLQPLANN